MSRLRFRTHASATALAAGLGASMALAAGGTAYAQETGVETVTVTAQRVEQNLQQVPVAVSAFTSEQLRVNSINRIADVAQRTPNFTTTAYNQAEPEYYIRGIGTSVGVAGNAGGDPSVILMLDGAYLARGGANLDLYDLERIEVLRGPQGTLFGKNALGGVMQIVTRKPTDEFFYEFSGTYGNYNRTDGRALVNGPISDTVSGTASVAITRHNGYTFNETTGHHDNDDNTLGGRVSLRYQPNDDIDWVVTADMTNVHANGNTRHNNCDASFQGGIHCVGINPSPRVTNSTDDGFLHRDVWGINSSLDWKTEFGTFTSVTAYRDSKYDHLDTFFSNPINPPNQIESINRVTEHSKDFSQEFRLAFSAFDDRLTGQTGVYYFNERVDRNYWLNQIFPVPAVTGKVQFPQVVNSQSTAVFGQINYKIIDEVTLTAGLRSTWESKTARLQGQVLTGPGFGPPLSTPYDVKAGKSWTAMTPHFGIEWRATEDAMLYVTASRGFKSGGYQGSASDGASAATAYNPEYAWSYEIGAKTQWLDNRLRLNLDAFKTLHKDLQVSQLVPLCCIVIGNAARAREQGVEVEMVAVPLPGLQINASYGYLEAKYTSFATGATSDNTGKRLPRAPQNKINIGAQYSFPAWGYGIGLIRGDWSHQSSIFFDPSNNPTTLQDGYSTFDARLSLTSEDGRWEAALWGKNLTDELVKDYIVAFDAYHQQLNTYTPPRTFGITLTFHS